MFVSNDVAPDVTLIYSLPSIKLKLSIWFSFKNTSKANIRSTFPIQSILYPIILLSHLIVSKAITGAQFDLTANNFDGAYIPWEEEDGNTGFVRHGVTTAKLNPWGEFTLGSATDVKNFVVNVPHVGVYYILKFNDKVASATACNIYYGGHMSSNDLVSSIDWLDACYECGVRPAGSFKYDTLWWTLRKFTWSTSKITVTDPDDLKYCKIVSVAAKNASKHLSPDTSPNFRFIFRGIWDRSSDVSIDQACGASYVWIPISDVTGDRTQFVFVAGGSKFYIKLDAPGLAATQAEVWYKEL